MQKQIESTVTNGIGYREKSGYTLRRLYEALKHGMVLGDTEIDLQIHLGKLETITAESDFAKNLIWKQILALGEAASQLSTYGLRGKIQTPEEVSSLIQGYFMKKKIENAKQHRESDPIYNFYLH